MRFCIQIKTEAEHTVGRLPCRENAAVTRLLEALVHVTGLERAYLVGKGPHGPRVHARYTARRDGREGISRGLSRRALGGTPRGIADLRHPARQEDCWVEQASVRRLELRSMISRPIPRRRDALALVLDSRNPGRDAEFQRMAPIVDRFAGLIGALLEPDQPEQAAPDDLGLAGRSAAIEGVRRAIRRAAPYRVPVLIRGPSGSGKERVARALHRLSGRSGSFVAVNCCALPEALLEAELFGAVRGAYTGIDRDRRGLFRRAEGGTLLLDEIGDMPAGMQAKLLRVLQEGAVRPVGSDTEEPVDVRILSATHRELDLAAARGRFREDLLYRIRMVPIDLPALAERGEDIPELCRALIGDLARRHGLTRGAIDGKALEHLRRHSWPGNVRELEAVLVRGLIAADGGDIREEHLNLDDSAAAAGNSRLEREMIEQALTATRHNLTRAARRIGWSRQKLYRRIESLGICRRPDADDGA